MLSQRKSKGGDSRGGLNAGGIPHRAASSAGKRLQGFPICRGVLYIPPQKRRIRRGVWLYSAGTNQCRMQATCVHEATGAFMAFMRRRAPSRLRGLPYLQSCSLHPSAEKANPIQEPCKSLVKKSKRLPRDHFLMAGGAAKTAVVRGFSTQNLGGVMSST